MSALDQLSTNHRRAIKEAQSKLSVCGSCRGKSLISYEPGCCYTVCPANKPDCPCKAAAPDLELEELAGRVNARIERINVSPSQ